MCYGSLYSLWGLAMSEFSKEKYDQNIKLAQRSFDNHRAFISDNNNHMVDLAGLAMKAPALVAAGGIAALLAFYSANWKDISKLEGSIQTFNAILTYFFLSLIFSMIAPCLAYLCTSLIGSSAMAEEYKYEPPYVHSTNKSRLCSIVSEVLRWLTVLAVFSAIVLIILGGWKFLEFAQPFTTIK